MGEVPLYSHGAYKPASHMYKECASFFGMRILVLHDLHERENMVITVLLHVSSGIDQHMELGIHRISHLVTVHRTRFLRDIPAEVVSIRDNRPFFSQQAMTADKLASAE